MFDDREETGTGVGRYLISSRSVAEVLGSISVSQSVSRCSQLVSGGQMHTKDSSAVETERNRAKRPNRKRRAHSVLALNPSFCIHQEPELPSS